MSGLLRCLLNDWLHFMNRIMELLRILLKEDGYIANHREYGTQHPLQ